MEYSRARKMMRRLFGGFGLVVLGLVAGWTAWHLWVKSHQEKSPANEVVIPDTGAPVPQPFHESVYEDVYSLEMRYWDRFERKNYTVKSGDNLSKILSSLGVSLQDTSVWQGEALAACRPEDLKPGDVLEIDVLRNTSDPMRLHIKASSGERRLLLKQGDAWVCRNEVPSELTFTETVLGTITDNLYSSCVEQGMPSALIMDLADLFAYDVDFTSDLQSGDRFAALYEITVADGRLVKAGPIRAAKMTVSGETHEAYLYEFPDGFSDYFDAQGRSLRKMFLKAPLSYRRISSTFTYRRLHPVLRIFRPHLGIDYAAPSGTPVSALGDGKVIKLGWNGGFGRYVEIQHDAVYKTSYGHLSDYARGLKVGSRVRQGDVIGYVGSSGLATGPHLDFRFYQNGTPVDFLKTSFPRARSIPKSLMADFMKKQREYASRISFPAVASKESVESGHP